MKRSLVVIVAVLVAVTAAALAGRPVAERWFAAGIKESIERDGTAQADAVSVDLVARRITVLGLRARSGLELRIGRLDVAGIAWPLGELLLGRTPFAGYRWGDPLILGRVELEKVKLASRSNELQWDVDRIVLDDVALARHDNPGGPSVRPVNRLARSLLALSVRRVEVANGRGSVPLSGGRDGGIGNIAIETYDGGRVGSVVLSSLWGVGFDRQPAPVTLAEVKLKGLSLQRLLLAMSSETWLFGGPSGRVSLDSLDVSGLGGELMRRYGLTVAGLSLQTTHDSAARSRARLRIDDAVLAPPLSGLQGLALRMTLQAMGLSQARAAFDCTLGEDRAKGEVAIEDCALQAPGLAAVGLALRIVNGDEALWQALDDGDLLMLADSRAGLASARLTVTDMSLLERSARAFAALNRQVATPAIRANWAREVRRFQPTGVMISQALTQVLDTVARFVEQGGTLTLEAKPDRPVGLDRFDYLAGPAADLVSAPGVTATLAKKNRGRSPGEFRPLRRRCAATPPHATHGEEKVSLLPSLREARGGVRASGRRGHVPCRRRNPRRAGQPWDLRASAISCFRVAASMAPGTNCLPITKAGVPRTPSALASIMLRSMISLSFGSAMSFSSWARSRPTPTAISKILSESSLPECSIIAACKAPCLPWRTEARAASAATFEASPRIGMSL